MSMAENFTSSTGTLPTHAVNASRVLAQMDECHLRQTPVSSDGTPASRRRLCWLTPPRLFYEGTKEHVRRVRSPS